MGCNGEKRISGPYLHHIFICITFWWVSLMPAAPQQVPGGFSRGRPRARILIFFITSCIFLICYFVFSYFPLCQEVWAAFLYFPIFSFHHLVNIWPWVGRGGLSRGRNIIVLIFPPFIFVFEYLWCRQAGSRRLEQGQASGSNVIIFCLLLFSHHLHYILMPPSRL